MFRKLKDMNKPMPKCPYCEARFEKPIKYHIGYYENMYACPKCLRVLGFAQSEQG